LTSPAWTYSDWITYASDSATRLSRLRLHIQEVSDRISSGSYASEGKSHDYGFLQDYLAELMKKEKSEATIADTIATTPKRSSFTRGVPWGKAGG
jgi:hypothetical protein